MKGYGIKIIGVATVLVLMTNLWLLVVNMHTLKDNAARLKLVEKTRFTAKDGDEMRAMVLRNREETLTNRKRGDEIIEMLKRLEEKAK